MLKIAILGTRGIPANYGGYETFAEELSVRLVRKGLYVTVYGRSGYIDKKYNNGYYKGVHIRVMPSIKSKYFDTVSHAFLSILNVAVKKYDIILICNAANSIFSLIPRVFCKKVVVNVDGIERLRKKWNIMGRLWYLFGEIFSCLFPDAVVTDARVIQDYYLKRYRKKSYFIPYGANINKTGNAGLLKKYNLDRNDYFLYVSRLEPENNAHVVIKAFEKVKTDKKLIIVGDAPYSGEYIKKLKETKDKRIIFTGFVFGEGYKELLGNAYCYIHATEVGGTHPALIEAMGYGNCVIVNSTPENIEVIKDCGIIYEKNNAGDLERKINYVIGNPDIAEKYGLKAVERIKKYYSWEYVTEEYEKLFSSLMKGKKIK
ncbi:MAG: glycosyltransferase [Actinomycetota bacterium]|nr:glycosyltransferase [Actinomycetota bacterium]